MSEDKKIHGVCLSAFTSYKQLIIERKNSIILKKMNSEILAVSNGFSAESHKDGCNKFLIELNDPCVLKIELTDTMAVLKIFRRSDAKFKQNVLTWPVEYLCKDFCQRGDMNDDMNLSVVKISVGPGCSSTDDGRTANIDASHFASYKSVLILRCSRNEWLNINNKINIMISKLPLAVKTLSHLDSGNSSSDSL